MADDTGGPRACNPSFQSKLRNVLRNPYYYQNLPYNGATPLYLVFEQFPEDALAYNPARDTELRASLDETEFRLLAFYHAQWQQDYANRHNLPKPEIDYWPLAAGLVILGGGDLIGECLSFFGSGGGLSQAAGSLRDLRGSIRNGGGESRATGQGAFWNTNTEPYYPEGKIKGQVHEGSCVAASCGIILSDHGVYLPEAYIRNLANIDVVDGGFLSQAPKALNTALESAGSTQRYSYEYGLSLNQLRAATQKGSALVDVNGHILVVDGFEGSKVLIRDPLPQGQGSAYKVAVDDFTGAWRQGRAVILNP